MDKKLYMVLKGFPNESTKGQHYKFGDKSTVILYLVHNNINHHAGTPKQKQMNTTMYWYEFRSILKQLRIDGVHCRESTVQSQ